MLLSRGAALVARGEFSIVIAGLGVAAGLEPGLGPLSAAYVLLLAYWARAAWAPFREPAQARGPAPTLERQVG